ncbi:MAG TPA: serine/threonine-protein kinase [Acidobacteriota bacterium]|nr:serine/threonine-protein kinase [Acidobacteriota bacterium]
MAEKLRIFEQACRLKPPERDAYLDRACDGNPQLRQEMERLVLAHDSSGLLDAPGEGLMPSSSEIVEGIAEKPGDRLGPYRLIRLLGEGGFGAVFLAEQEAPLKRKVALKILKPGMDSRPIIARFQAERQALARMDHPCIARVYDAGATDKGRPYFVMEYVEGTSLTRYCDDNELDIRSRLELFLEVAQAVHHAHQKGVIHRDLKPSNLMVTEVAGKPQPKVIDFGIAKALHEPLTDATLLTQHGQVVGTPEYMSPEQAESSGRGLDIRSDVYSLGVVLYELLVGVRPFPLPRHSPSGHREWLQKVRNEDPPRPSQRLRNLPDSGKRLEISGRRRIDPAGLQRRLKRELDWIVLKALDRQRNRRYASVAALAEDIERHLSKQAVQAAPPSASYRLGQMARRHKGFLSAAAAVLLALLAGLGFATYAFIQASLERDLARNARDEAEAVVSFLSSMMSSADPGEKGREVTVLEVLDESAPELDASFADRPSVAARLHETVGKTYLALGREEEAGKHLETALAVRERDLGPDHRLTLMAASALGGAYYAQGYHLKAEEQWGRALQGLGKILDEDDQVILGIMNNLAQVYANRGRLDEAESMQMRVLELQTAKLGANHPNTLGSRINLAQLRSEMGRLEEAHGMLEEVCADWLETFGEDHPGTLLALNNLSLSHMALQQWEEAEAVMRRVWEKRREVLGPHHYETWGSQYNLASILSSMGRGQEGYELLKDMVMAPLGKSLHPVRVQVLVYVLTLYESQGWPEQIRPLLPHLGESIRRVAEDPDTTALQLNNAAWFLLHLPDPQLRSPQLALSAANRSCQLEREQGGPDLWRFLDTLALAQHENGDSRSAARTQQEAIQQMPQSAKEQYLPELEKHLRRYQEAAGTGESAI